MRVRLLGPVDVVVAGASRPVRGLRRKAVLAVLALSCGEVVSTDRLVDAVWGQAPPVTAVNTVQSHVSHLRHVLGSKVAIVARSSGYVLDLDGEATDVGLAERLIRQGTQSADSGYGARQLETALALWRGRALVDVAELSWFAEQAGRLDQLWLQATRALIEIRLARGEHARLVPDLEDLVRDHPFDEQLHGQLMVALYGSGRQADALSVFQRLRRTLDEDLGIDPSPALRDLEAAVLRQDPAIDPTVATVTLPAGVPVPAQLPLAVRAFSGRDAELASLDALLAKMAGSEPDRPAAAVISAVSGTAGVGKTALAVHWAHRVADRFPDGQLYVNLRGFDPTGSALDPATAVHGFLEAFGVPAQRIPADPQARTALYRSLLAGKRVLIVVDNARDVEQVRPLLPGSAGCLAVVTSRNQLTGLVAAEGAHPLTLDLLTPTEARELLTRRLGVDRVAREPDAVNAIIARCARLPLALAIAAARATHADFPLTALAAELREDAGTLDAFHGDDPATDVRAVLSWSYRTVSTDAARLFGLLGLHPGPDFTPAAAASLAGIPGGQARAPLAELTRAHLLTEHVPGRYTFHDLLRAFATEHADRDHSAEARLAAALRLADHYLHTAHHNALLLLPHRDPITLAAAAPGVAPESLTGHDSALSWFAAESRVLLAVIDLAATAGFDAHVWQLAWAFTTFLLRRGHWHDMYAVHTTALHAATRLADTGATAYVQRSLGVAAAQQGDLDKAGTHYHQALRLFADAGDQAGRALTHLNLAKLAEQHGRPADALRHSKQALELYRGTGHRVGQPRALNAVGRGHAQLGEHRRALGYCQQALTLLKDLGYRVGEARTWDSLGYIHAGLADHDRAAGCYRLAIDLFQELGDRHSEADSLIGLGDSHHAAGESDSARAAWKQALTILEQLGHPDHHLIRARLHDQPQLGQAHSGDASAAAELAHGGIVSSDTRA
jgi:DNA-binding SARP family transcriptional activator/tetratricopeptide (TPR) repeat protein